MATVTGPASFIPAEVDLYVVMFLAGVINLVCFNKFPQARKNKRYVCFALVCTFRAWLPRLDAERVCYWDVGLLGSPFFGRLAATFAEISFGSLMGEYLWLLSTANKGSQYVRHPETNLIGHLTKLAQVFCWYGVATQNQLYNMIEESLWALCAGIALVYALMWMPNKKRDTRVVAFLTGTAVYFVYMVLIDVPMYYRRWSRDYRGISYKTFGEGILEMGVCHKTTQDNKFWHEDFLWMSGYFSVGVAASLMAALAIERAAATDNTEAKTE